MFAVFRGFSRIFILRKYSIVFIAKNVRTAARNLFNICRSQLYIPHSVIKNLATDSQHFADIYFAKILHSFYCKKCANCRSQPFQHLPRSTIFPIQGLRIWLLIPLLVFSLAPLLFPKFLKVKCSSPPPAGP